MSYILHWSIEQLQILSSRSKHRGTSWSQDSTQLTSPLIRPWCRFYAYRLKSKFRLRMWMTLSHHFIQSSYNLYIPCAAHYFITASNGILPIHAPISEQINPVRRSFLHTQNSDVPPNLIPHLPYPVLKIYCLILMFPLILHWANEENHIIKTNGLLFFFCITLINTLQPSQLQTSCPKEMQPWNTL